MNWLTIVQNIATFITGQFGIALVTVAIGISGARSAIAHQWGIFGPQWVAAPSWCPLLGSYKHSSKARGGAMRTFGTDATPFERRIAKHCGVADVGLATLLQREKTGRTGNNACPRLVRRGLVKPEGGLTDAGRAVIARARGLGY